MTAVAPLFIPMKTFYPASNKVCFLTGKTAPHMTCLVADVDSLESGNRIVEMFDGHAESSIDPFLERAARVRVYVLPELETALSVLCILVEKENNFRISRRVVEEVRSQFFGEIAAICPSKQGQSSPKKQHLQPV